MLTRLEVEALVQQCSQILEQPLHEKICRKRAVLDKFTKLQECAGITSRENAVSTHDKDLKTVAEFFLGKNAKLNVLSDLEGSETSFLYYSETYSVSAELFYCVRKLMFHIAASEYLLIRRKTRAIYDLMAFFDESYALQTRRQGLLTFQDILYLINSKEKSDYGVLQMLRERLALNIDHYLLDEFQDTSDTQWSAMRDLISDVIQWNEESRFTSFFMVADVKQSLYQWRKGNPEIFWNICSVYGIIPEEDVGKMQAEDEVCNGVLKGLNCSYRSASAVLQMVNDIFHDPQGTVTFPDRLAAQTIPFHTQRAKMNFLPHISGLGPGVQGGSMFLEVEAPEHKDLACILQEGKV